MPIEFRCVGCGKLLRTRDDTAGRQAKCPECGAIVTVPPAAAPVPQSPSAREPTPRLPDDLGGAYDVASPFGPPAAAGPPSSPITPSPLGVGEVFSRTWSILKPNWGICLGVVLLAWVIGFGFQMVAGMIPILGPLASMVFQMWIDIGAAIFFLKKARGQEAKIDDIFKGWPFFWRIFLASLLVGLIIFGVILVCVVPLLLVGIAISQNAAIVLSIVGGLVAIGIMVYLQLALSQFYYLIIDRDIGVIESLKTSMTLMQGNKLTLFAIGLINALLALAAVLTLCLGFLIVAPYLALMAAVIYLIITGQPLADQMASGVLLPNGGFASNLSNPFRE